MTVGGWADIWIDRVPMLVDKLSLAIGGWVEHASWSKDIMIIGLWTDLNH